MTIRPMPFDGATFTLTQLHGRLDWTAGGAIERLAVDRRALGRSETGLVLDLDGLEFCDSVGLGVLVALAAGEREGGRELVLCRLRPALRRMLEAVRLHGHFLLCDDVDSAARWLADAAPTAPMAQDTPTAPAPFAGIAR